MEVYLEGIGVLGPGLNGWAASRLVLNRQRGYEARPAVLPPSPLLPANERRRTVATVKLALAVATEAFAHAKRDPRDTVTVFASSGGDGETIHAILETLATPERDVSPTRFHNSLHNAPSGYWNIANQTREPATSLCAHDVSFGVGLLDAAVHAVIDERPVGFIAYDLPYPEPLNTVRPIASIFGVALVLAPTASATALARLSIALDRGATAPAPLPDPALEALRAGNPAARSLSLLAALASERPARLTVEHVLGNRLVVSVDPLS